MEEERGRGHGRPKPESDKEKRYVRNNHKLTSFAQWFPGFPSGLRSSPLSIFAYHRQPRQDGMMIAVSRMLVLCPFLALTPVNTTRYAPLLAGSLSPASPRNPEAGELPRTTPCSQPQNPDPRILLPTGSLTRSLLGKSSQVKGCRRPDLRVAFPSRGTISR